MIQTRVSMAALSLVDLVGSSGRRYALQYLIQERQHVGRVWLASSGGNRFILKDIPPSIHAAFRENIQPRLPHTPRIRIPLDTIPDRDILVYRYLTEDFLSLAKKQIPIQARKQILKTSLQGIAELHDRDIVHLDIKPDNIIVNHRHADQKMVIEQVQVSDLENAAYLPKPRCIKGMLAGNANWRSPEGHFKGELNKPSDLYSFGLVCIYAVLGRVILGRDADLQIHEAKGALPQFIRLQRQISYFGDIDGLKGLKRHVVDEEINHELLDMLWEDRSADYIPYVPFAQWADLEPMFKDLILRLTSLDPANRPTAREASGHPWFEGAGIV